MQCINKYNVCNKYTDCHDESDEDVDMCKGTLYIVVLKLNNLVHTTHFFNNLHRVNSESKDWKSQFIKVLVSE